MTRTKKNYASLFDRFDEDIAQQLDAGLTHQQLKTLIIRDLLSLLNTTNTHNGHTSHQTQSVINYGISPISGKRASEIDWKEVENDIKNAILYFEPRIIKDSLTVNCLFHNNSQFHHNQMNIEITGFMNTLPFPEKIVLKTSLDIETGYFQPII